MVAAKLVFRFANGVSGHARSSSGGWAAAWGAVAALLISLLSVSPAFAQAPTATQAIATVSLTQFRVISSITPVTGSGGTAPLTYSVSPTLPSGLSFNTANGAITGTPNVSSVATTYTVTVTDANSLTASNTFVLTVNGPVSATQAVAGVTLTQNHAATGVTPVTGAGGTGPLSYSISPALPAGLSIDTSLGALVGTPTVTHATSSFTVTVTDVNGASASNTFSLAVNSAVTATQAVPSATLTQNHAATSFTPVTGGGGTAPLAYGINPSLPSGLSINPSTGAVSGTPTVSIAATTFTVTVTDANGATASNTFSLTVNGAVTATQAIAFTSVTVERAVTPFTPVTGAGGTGSLSYSVTPTLPAGMAMTTSNGSINGLPVVATGATTYTVTITDQNGETASNTFVLAVSGPVLARTAIATTTLTQNHAATPFTPVTGSGGTTPLTYSVAPALPAGLTLAAATGTITGTPTATSASQSYTVTVTDANGATATANFNLSVNAAVTATTAVASVVMTVNHAATPFTPVTGGGGTGALTYSVSPALPAGLSIASTTGQISGTPTAAHAAASYTVTVTDTVGATATANFSLTVNGPVTATTAIASTALTVNRPATSFTPVTGAGGTGALTYGVSPALPAGLSFNTANGAVTGTPTATSAASSYTVTVTDGNGATATASFSLTVDGSVTATTAVASTALIVNNAAASFTPVTGAGGTNPLTYSVSPTLPAGLSFNTANGAITGTPTVTSAAATYTVTVTDANGATASATFSLTVRTGATTMALTSSQNPSSFGQAVTFSATVSGTGGTPGGTVNFSDGGVVIGSAALSGGVAALAISTLKTGTHSITAAYGGNGSYSASTSPVLTQTVNVPADSIRLRALQVNVTKVVAQGSGQAISGAVDSAISDGFAGGGALLTRSGTGFHYNFAADPDEQGGGEASAATAGARGNSFGGMTNAYGTSGNNPSQRGSRIDDAFAALDRQMPTKAAPTKYREEKDWMLWADVRGSGLDRMTSTTTAAGVTTAAAPMYGYQINALLGLTYKVNPNFLVGAFGGYETFNYTEQDINGKLTGDGWTVGAYLGWKLAPMLRYDLAVAYSGIGYDGVAGTAQGNFDGHRWLVSTGVTGSVKTMGFEIEPSAKVYVLWENEGAYVDSLGTQQASRDFSTGRASTGAKASYPIAWSDSVKLAPFLGVYADYYFDQDNAAAIVSAGGVPLASTPLLSGWSARVTSGLGATFASGASVAAGAEYGGIGSNFETWTFTARARVPF